LPHGGIIAGLIVGLIILFWGVYLILQQTGVITGTVNFWIILLIILGVLMIIGAIYQMTRRRGTP